MGGRRRRGKKEERIKDQEARRRGGEELTVKARAGSPELSVGSTVSGYHAV